MEQLLAAASIAQDSADSTSHLESWIFWVFGGGVCSLIVGAIGGGLKALSVTIPKLTAVSRVSLVLVGAGLVGSGLWFGPIAESAAAGEVADFGDQGEIDESGMRTIGPGSQKNFDGLIVFVDGKRQKLETGATELKVPAGAEVKIVKKELGFRREMVLRPAASVLSVEPGDAEPVTPSRPEIREGVLGDRTGLRRD